jgi:hypothetical protein
VNCKKIENLKSDLDEFNKLIKIATRQVVKEAVLTEVKAVTTKTENIKALNYNWKDNKASWTEVIKGSKKLVVIAGQPILVVSNCYQPLSSHTVCDAERRLLMHVENSEKDVKTLGKEKGPKKIILIVGDSHVKGMAMNSNIIWTRAI